MAVLEGNQAPRADQHLLAAGGLPQDLAIQRAGAHVEPPVEAQHVRARQPERLVVDEQLDDASVGDAEHRLPGAREAVGLLAVDDRPGLVEAVDEGAVLHQRAALLRRAAHAQIAVAEREDGLGLRHELGMEAALDPVPLVGDVIVRRRLDAFVCRHDLPD